MILVVTYDLKSKRDYRTLYTAIQRQGSWWHYMASTWLISTPTSPEQLARELRPFIDQNDSLFVAEIGAYAGYLPQQAWKWIADQKLTLADRIRSSSPTETRADKARALDKILGERGKK